MQILLVFSLNKIFQFWMIIDQVANNFRDFMKSIYLPGEPEKSYHFSKFIAPRLPHGFESFKS